MFLKKVFKKYSTLIVSAPLMVDDSEFGFDDDSINAARYSKYRKRAVDLIHDFGGGVGLYRLPAHVIMFDDNAKRILYFVRFEIKSIFGHKFVIQKILWRSPAVAQERFKIKAASVTSYVFFEKLLPLADGIGIATDSMQTPGGKRFWLDRIAQAFDRNLYVYLIDQNTKDKTLIRDLKEISDKASETWTTQPAGEARRIILTPQKIW